VTASAETSAVPHSGDAADDPAIWVHPTDPALSVVIGTDKLGGLAVYDLTGSQLHYYSGIKPNNVDLRYGFRLGGQSVDLVAASETDSDTILLYRVDPATRGLVSVRAAARDTGIGVAGICMYHSPATGKFYVIIGDDSGINKQFELYDTGAGTVDYRLVRTLKLGSMTEGCVADDERQMLYIAEEDVAIWRFGAEPDAGTSGTKVALAGDHLTPDIEGLAISPHSDGTGCLLASSQGSDDFAVFDRLTYTYLGRFRIDAGTVDGVSHTDGIDVVGSALGPTFPRGLFVAQDDSNSGANQDFKLVSWKAIADGMGLP
jgi:3-phytase